MKKTISVAAAIALASLSLTACSSDDKGGSSEGKYPDYKACLVSDAGGWDDKSFNQSAMEGLKEAEKDLGVQTGSAESNEDKDFQPNVDSLTAGGCNMVIGVGFLLEDAIHNGAVNYPDLHFGLVDGTFKEPTDNARALVFNTAEAAYLAGYVAASVTETGKVGTFGGMNIPTVTIFMDGFYDGVMAYNEAHDAKIEVLGWDKTKATGQFTGNFDDKAQGVQVAKALIAQGADIIMPVAGPVGLGAASAAKEADNVLIVGVDSDWYESAPEFSSIILTSVVKEIGAAVKQAIEDGASGNYTTAAYVGTLENGGVSIAPFHDFDSKVSDEVKAEVDDLKAKIISGELKVESDSTPKSE